MDCMVALPGQLFYSTQIPACLWFLARRRSARGARSRGAELLFVDARRLGRMVTRRHRELTQAEIARIANTYRAWRGAGGTGDYEDVPGFCRSAPLEEIPEARVRAPSGPLRGCRASRRGREPLWNEDEAARLGVEGTGGGGDAVGRRDCEEPRRARLRDGEMTPIDYSKLRLSLQRLVEQHEIS